MDIIKSHNSAELSNKQRLTNIEQKLINIEQKLTQVLQIFEKS